MPNTTECLWCNFNEGSGSCAAEACHNVGVINTTLHEVVILNRDNTVFRVYPKGEFSIRLASQTVPDGELPDGCPQSRTDFGEAQGLPAFEEGTFYIVSQLVKNALPGRSDLRVPAEVQRDEKGVIIGCYSLGR